MARGFSAAPGASPDVSLASDPDLPRPRLLELIESKNSVVRETLAARNDLPLGAMVSLAHDSSGEVRSVLAANPTLVESLLDVLVRDKDHHVLAALVQRPDLPYKALQLLAFHKRKDIRELAAARLDAGEVATRRAREAALPMELQERGLI